MDINDQFAEGRFRTPSATAPALLYLLHPCSRVLCGIRTSLFSRSPNSGCRNKCNKRDEVRRMGVRMRRIFR